MRWRPPRPDTAGRSTCVHRSRCTACPEHAIFLNDSRFGRFEDPDEAAHWRFELSRYGWIVRFVENDDTENVTIRHVMRAVGGAQASEYLVNVKANAIRGARGAASEGLWQREAPFGYRREATAPGREPVLLEPGQRKSDDQKVRLAPGPKHEVELVRWAYETYAAGGISLGGLAKEMRARAPRLKWSKQSIGKMLSNPAYAGDVVWCRRPHGKAERQERWIRPPSEWVGKTNAHSPLVSRELFAAVQARLAKNKKQTRATQGGYPLSGLIHCAICGMPYGGGGGAINRRDPSDPDRYRFYKDSGSAADPSCPGRTGTLTKRIVEPLVVEEISRVVSDPLVRQMIGEEIDRQLAAVLGDPEPRRMALLEERKALKTKRENLVRAVASGILSDSDAGGAMAEIRDGLARVETDLLRLEATAAAAEEIAAHRERLAALAADFAEQAARMGGAALRALLEPWLEAGTFDKNTRLLTLIVRRVPAAATRAAGIEWRGRHVKRMRAVPGGRQHAA